MASIRESQVTKAVGKMNEALRRKYEQIGKHQVAGRSLSAQHSYEVGVIVNEVASDADHYGARAVKLLARALGRDEDSLYDYARVATCWARDEFVALIARFGPYRKPLSFSHLVTLARVPSPATRSRLLETALKEGLSVRELRSAVRGRAPGTPTGAPDAARFGKVADATLKRLSSLRASAASGVGGDAAARAAASRYRELAAEALRLAEALERRPVRPQTGLWGQVLPAPAPGTPA